MSATGLALRTPSGRTVGSKSWPLAGGNPVQNAWTQGHSLTTLQQNNTFDLLYRRQPWVYICVNKLSRAIGRLPLKTYSMSAATGERQEERTIPLAKLMEKPWPLNRQYCMSEYIVATLAVYGNCTLVKFRGGNGQTPIELWPLPWPQVEVLVGVDTPIEGYRWTGRTGLRRVFLPEDVVHFKYYNPNPDQPYGVSPLEPLANTLALEDSAQRYGISSFGNAARPASFIKSERNLTRQQRRELREEIEQSYGGPENAFKVALLDNGLDWKPLAFSASEAQLVDMRRISREEVAAVYDIQPPMIGILDRATYSNISEQHWMFYMDTLAPICNLIEDTFQAQLIDVEPAWDGAFVEYYMDAVLKGHIEQRSQSYQRFLQSGVYTPNELREMENEEPIDDPAANAIYLPVNMNPVSPEIRKLSEEAQTQAEEAAQHMRIATERMVEGTAAEGALPPPIPGSNPNPPAPPPPKTRQERQIADLYARLDAAGL